MYHTLDMYIFKYIINLQLYEFIIVILNPKIVDNKHVKAIIV
jgi:hypothetical protein